jgi:MFS family permease
MLSVISVAIYPVVGRLADRITSRITALVGAATAPILFLGLSAMSNLTTYAVLFLLQVVFLSATTPPVYCRIIVQRFRLAKGLALAIAVAGPSLIAAVGGPLLNNFVVDYGWRAGYMVLSVTALIGGGLAIVLMPAEQNTVPSEVMPSRAAASPKISKVRADYRMIFRMRAFWLLNGGVLLCAMPMSVLLTQLGLIVAEHGLVDKSVSLIVSSYAIGMLVGRLASGAALDNFPAPLVATISLMLSAAGLFAMSRDGASAGMIAFAVMTVGLSFGAESDIVGYLIARNFPMRIYSTVFGMVASTISISTATGVALLALMLDRTGSYAPFLMIASASVFAGSLLFLLLPRQPLDRIGEAPSEEAAAMLPWIKDKSLI